MTRFEVHSSPAGWSAIDGRREAWFAAATIVALFLAAVALRPALPIDETRYLTVAWELLLRGDWLGPLTLNFELYVDKPPLLFWLIDASWSVFGVSRWAAILPVVLAAAAVVVLTAKLCRALVPEVRSAVVYVLAGSLPFLLYGNLVMFDLTLTVFVLGVLLCLIDYARTGRRRAVLLAGLLLGAAVLTKGPVAWLHVLFPALSWPLWRDAATARRGWYPAMLAMLALSLLPVLAWLVPTLARTDNGGFAYSLLWEQTAARILGDGTFTHARPAWFYLPFLALFGIPWLLLPRFWRQLPELRRVIPHHRGLRFLAAWLLPTVLAFSLVRGKQPHYLLPLLPGFAILAAWLLREATLARIRNVATAVVLACVALNLAASLTVFPRYDLQPVARYVAAHRDADWAFTDHYEGQLGFLARLRSPIATPPGEELTAWFAAHAGGRAIAAYRYQKPAGDFREILSIPYRGKHMGVFAARSNDVAVARVRTGDEDEGAGAHE